MYYYFFKEIEKELRLEKTMKTKNEKFKNHTLDRNT